MREKIECAWMKPTHEIEFLTQTLELTDIKYKIVSRNDNFLSSEIPCIHTN